MSSQVYPSLPGLEYPVNRSYVWKTFVQEALSGKQSTLAGRLYPLVHWELTYSVLREPGAAGYGGATTSELKQLVGLHNQMQGRLDTFLFTDPDFNTFTAANPMFFGTGTGSQTVYQLVAFYQNTGGPGNNEIIQNLNGAPQILENRYGNYELLSTGLRTNLALQSKFAATWTTTGTGSTFVANSSIAPDGTNTAALYNDGPTAQIYSVQEAQVALLTAGQQVCASVWVRINGNIQLILDDGSNAANSVAVCFNGVNGTFAAPLVGANATWIASSMTPFPNGWYRCSVACSISPTATTLRMGLCLSANSTSAFYPTTNLGAGSFFVWGAQIEAGTQPTALIQTTTSHASNGGSDYSIGPTGIVTFISAPQNGALLAWAGSFFYRCRFDEDAITYKKFMNFLWSVGVKFTSVKL